MARPANYVMPNGPVTVCLGDKPGAIWIPRLACLLYAGALTSLLLAPHVERFLRFWFLPLGPGGMIVHFVAFVGFAFLARASRPPLARRRLLALLAGYAVAVELLQFLSPPRTPEWGDAMANLLGLGMGWALGELAVKSGTSAGRADMIPKERFRLLTRENLATYDTFIVADDVPDDFDPDLAVVVHELSGRRMTVHRTRLLPAAHVDPSRFDHGHHSPCPTCGRVEGIVEEEVRCPYDDHGACGMMHASH